MSNLSPSTFKMPMATYMLLILLLISCQNRELTMDDDCPDDIEHLVRIVIHWQAEQYATMPVATGMVAHLFQQTEGHVNLQKAVSVEGGWIRPAQGCAYLPVCYDYDSNNVVYYRHEESPESFEAYCRSASGTYNKYVDQGWGEPTVAEPSPTTLYMARYQQPFNVDYTRQAPQQIDYYPENVLHTFTFSISGVPGAKYAEQAHGAISGTSANYYPAYGLLGKQPSTLLFDHVQLHRDGHITGSFTTFGFVDLNSGQQRLTIETLTPAGHYYYATWGYWHGKWEDCIAKQLRGAWGEHGSPEEQANWRLRNGGYDILLNNEDGRLHIPADPSNEGNKGNGGFEVDTSEWDTVVVPIG
jgi:hypothetical protein